VGDCDGDSDVNNNKTLITHMQTDPNAWKHSLIGMAASIVGGIAGHIVSMEAMLICVVLLPLCAGIGIEIIQRLQGGKNTNRESFMDALTTWLWPVYYAISIVPR